MADARATSSAFLRVLSCAGALAFAMPLGGCLTQTYQRGYVMPEGALEQLPVGSSQEQVLIVLGTPSTVATVSGEVFYYISQKTEQTSFMPQKITDQRVIAVFFDKNRRVEKVANYGMQDGRVIDFVTRTTPAGGRELTAMTYVYKIIGKE